MFSKFKPVYAEKDTVMLAVDFISIVFGILVISTGEPLLLPVGYLLAVSGIVILAVVLYTILFGRSSENQP
jgi:hypothetical protein